MLFISRTLGKDSPLRSWANDRGIVVRDQSLLSFTPVPFEIPEQADWWFFYSSRAVSFAADRLPAKEILIGAIGPSTAQSLIDRGHRVDFCGNGNPEQTAIAFQKVGEGSRVFFPRARQSRLSVQNALKDRITVLDAICYDNRIMSPEQRIDAAVYIFTSPLNVAAYLDCWPLMAGARVLAIGPSTGAALRRRGVSCEWPLTASEEGLVELLDSQRIS